MEVAAKLRTRVTELAAALDLAAAKQVESTAIRTAGELELNKAKTALAEAMGERVQRERFAPVEQAYHSAADAYDAVVYELKSVDQKLAVCRLAEEFSSLRGTDSEKAEAVMAIAYPDLDLSKSDRASQTTFTRATRDQYDAGDRFACVACGFSGSQAEEVAACCVEEC